MKLLHVLIDCLGPAWLFDLLASVRVNGLSDSLRVIVGCLRNLVFSHLANLGGVFAEINPIWMHEDAILSSFMAFVLFQLLPGDLTSDIILHLVMIHGGFPSTIPVVACNRGAPRGRWVLRAIGARTFNSISPAAV